METRQRLLDVAHEEFSRRRVADVSLSDIARRAGFTKGAVYSNFDSKADLLVAVLENRMQNQGVDYIDIIDRAPDERAMATSATSDSSPPSGRRRSTIHRSRTDSLPCAEHTVNDLPRRSNDVPKHTA